jgi:hypothetical protein
MGTKMAGQNDQRGPKDKQLSHTILLRKQEKNNFEEFVSQRNLSPVFPSWAY